MNQLYLSYHDIWGFLILLAALLASSFSLYLPILYLTNNEKVTTKIAIPISFSIEIIFGYIFYCLRKPDLFVTIWCLLILSINVFYFLKLRKKILPAKINFKMFVLFLTILIPVIYSRFHDSVTNIAPGIADTYNHVLFLRNIRDMGHISLGYYPPGFHLLIYPISKLVGFDIIYRFTGPILGLIATLFLYLMLKDHFRSNKTKLSFFLISCFPFFNPMILMNISFWPSALTFVFMGLFIYLIVAPDKIEFRTRIAILTVSIIALALTAPYFFVQFFCALLLLYVISLTLAKALPKEHVRLQVWFMGLIIAGVFVSFLHVFLQTQVLSQNGYFPEINSTQVVSDRIIVKSNFSELGQFINNVSNRIDSSKIKGTFIAKSTKNFVQSGFFRSNVWPVSQTGIELIRPKSVLPINNINTLKTYLWILMCFALVFYSAKKNNWMLLVVSAIGIVYGISAQTGLAEMGDYRGRSGWYVYYLAFIQIVLLIDLFLASSISKQRLVKYLELAVFIFLYLISFFRPPSFDRTYCKTIFNVVQNITQKNSQKTIALIAGRDDLSVLSEKVRVLPLDTKSLDDPDSDLTFLILNNDFCDTLPGVYKKTLAYNDILQKFEGEKAKSHEENIRIKTEIQKSAVFLSEYHLYWQDASIQVFQKNLSNN